MGPQPVLVRLTSEAELDAITNGTHRVWLTSTNPELNRTAPRAMHVTIPWNKAESLLMVRAPRMGAGSLALSNSTDEWQQRRALIVVPQVQQGIERRAVETTETIWTRGTRLKKAVNERVLRRLANPRNPPSRNVRHSMYQNRSFILRGKSRQRLSFQEKRVSSTGKRLEANRDDELTARRIRKFSVGAKRPDSRCPRGKHEEMQRQAVARGALRTGKTAVWAWVDAPPDE